MSSASSYLGQNGPFFNTIDNYQIRDSQLALCDAFERALTSGKSLTAEAGTGIGKTFAYLIPSLLSDKKIIISTGTRHLQDQLFYSDLPRVMSTLKITNEVALLKGRSNYLCLHRLQIAPHLGYNNRQTQNALIDINEWSKLTRTGDISELSKVPENDMVWSTVTSTADNCLGSECSEWEDCFIVKARKKAQSSKIVIINHHLLLADMTLKNEGFAELLPNADAFIIDEAHQLHEVAAVFFGQIISHKQLLSLANDAIAEQLSDAPDMSEIREYADDLTRCVQDFRLALGESGLKESWANLENKPIIQRAITRLASSLKNLSSTLEPASQRGRGLELCLERTQKIIQHLNAFESKLNTNQENTNTTIAGNEAGNNASEQNVDENILWVETYNRSFILHITPINVAPIFKQHTNNYLNTWLFTSATLQVDNKFNHFSRNIGLENFTTGVWQSPFDYQKQSLRYQPKNIPAPNSPDYTIHVMQQALPLLKASEGRAFTLFTSYRAMHLAHDFLKQHLPYPLLIQGDLPKHQLLEKFRQTKNAILLGTLSFWEGVDVRGESLSCVIIDKLPFASPGDPVIKARMDTLNKQGKSAFFELQLPQAVITLKQGVGRLIRDINDRGIIMIGDPRLTEKAYGKVFLNSLPKMPVTDNIKDIEQFFNRSNNHTSNSHTQKTEQ